MPRSMRSGARSSLTSWHCLLDPTGPEPPWQQRVLRVQLAGLGRLAVSLRSGSRHDEDAAVLPLTPDGLNDELRTFGHLPVYSDKFFDCDDGTWSSWRNRLSFDAQLDAKQGRGET